MVLYLFIHFYLLLGSADHALYISVLEIDKRQMKIKVFTDNLRDAVRNNTAELAPSTEKDFHLVNTDAIEAYFQEKVQLQINTKEMSFSLKETTLEGDSYWITFNLEKQEKWQSFYLEASYLMELFPDQTNVVKVLGDKPQFFRLTKFFSSCKFSL